MSKYFSLFQTESQYQAAKETLDFPNVSLIDTTGDLHYAKYIGQEVANAPFNSILMAEVATNKLFYIEDYTTYNLTDYPLADFKPIGVCIFPKELNNNNNAVFMGLKYIKCVNATKTDCYTTDDSSAKASLMFTYDTTIDLLKSKTASSKEVNKYIFDNYISYVYPGSGTIPQNTEGLGFICTSYYKTQGTNEGEWYVPSYYDMSYIHANASVTKQVYTTLRNLVPSEVINTDFLTRTKYSCTYKRSSSSCQYVYAYNQYGDVNGEVESRFALNAFPGIRILPVFLTGTEEV